MIEIPRYMAVCNRHHSKGPIRPYKPYDCPYDNNYPGPTAADAYDQARKDETKLDCVLIFPKQEYDLGIVDVTE